MARQFAIGIIILAVAAGGATWWLLSRHTPAIVWQGYAEADYVKVGPILQGLLTSVSVARGDEVEMGTPLFTQDDINDRAARDQAARQLGQAKGQLANLLAGGKETEIEQAEGNLADAQATLTRTELDYVRGAKLLSSGFETQQAVDQLQAAYLSAQAKVKVAAAALEQMYTPMGREGEIKAQRAAVAAAQAALEMAEWRLSQRKVVAPTRGRIVDVIAFAGETLDAGAPVVSLLPPENIFVRFFVPERQLSSMHYGDKVAFSCDGCAPNLSGTISFISPTAEYTPPLIYSEDTRAKLVYLIEARPPPDEAVRLNPGEPIQVRPVADARR